MALSQVGIAIHKPSAASILQTIVEAEAAGIPAVWLTTGAGPDALTVFAAAAVSTRHARMGTAIVPTFPRHPTRAVAQQAADIAQLASGRFVLGLGPSHAAIIEGR
jgi:alkanesulfonate monooxygenase SsuD/methylene tetrahydromethanopterin reductase-like flavin-dependent oxidoreductase (luciferase family)